MSPTQPVVRLVTDRLPDGPWIFARQVARPAAPVQDGALVQVEDASGRFVGHALYNSASDIRLRVLARGKKSDLAHPRAFLERKLAEADRLRRKRLRLDEHGDTYRIAHAEGDDLPGLVVDRLGDVIVCEHHSRGFWRWRADVEWALAQRYPEARIVHRVPRSVRRAERFEPEEEPPDLGHTPIRENELSFVVRAGHGHKTGWFCDQRDNRLTVGRLARGADVLDLCCNAGGFALQARRHGARRVRGVDLDEQVLALARESAAANRLEVDFEHADAFDVLRDLIASGPHPDLVVVDPHKVVADRSRLETGIKHYLDLNALALGAVRPGGLVATFSCSGLVDLPTFLGTVFRASRRAERRIRLLSTLGAAPDHPQRPEFPRSRYLKGALIAVD